MPSAVLPHKFWIEKFYEHNGEVVFKQPRRTIRLVKPLHRQGEIYKTSQFDSLPVEKRITKEQAIEVWDKSFIDYLIFRNIKDLPFIWGVSDEESIWKV